MKKPFCLTQHTPKLVWAYMTFFSFLGIVYLLKSFHICLFIYLLILCVYIREQLVQVGSLYALSMYQDQLRLLKLAAGAFILWAISLALNIFPINNQQLLRQHFLGHLLKSVSRQFSASTWHFTLVSSSRSRGSDALSLLRPPRALHACVVYTYTQAKHSYIWNKFL